MLLCADGVSEHAEGNENYAPKRLEPVHQESKNATARELFETVRDDLMAFASPSDGVTLVVIKRRQVSAQARIDVWNITKTR